MTKQQQKPPAKVSAYPYYSFQSALKIMGVVKAYGAGRNEVPKSVVAQEMKMAADSSALFAMIASAKSFGMVEGTRGLSLTKTGQRYCFPCSPTDQPQAALEFLNTPPVFKAILKQFDGAKLPATPMLANYLVNSRLVPKSWATRAAGLFNTSAAEVEVLDDEKFLRFESTKHQIGNEPDLLGREDFDSVDDEEPKPDQAAPITKHVKKKDQPQDEPPTGVTVWRAGVLRVETPNPMTKETWSLLRGYVELLNPNPKQDGDS